jgi:hypothetical protein
MADNEPEEGTIEQVLPKPLAGATPAGGGEPQVEYYFTREDLLAIMEHHTEHPPAGPPRRSSLWWAVLCSVVLGSVGLVRIILKGSDAGLWAYLAAGTAFPMLALLIFRRRLNRLLARRAVRRQPHLFERQRVALTANHIRNEVGPITNTIRWEGVGKIVVTNNYAFVYVSLANAIVIPRSAFAGKEAFDRFVETARRYRRQVAPTARDESEETGG